MTEAHTPNPIDMHVGGRIRARRRIIGVSQGVLAESLGLTFQQVQKYERGANRVSASKLYEIARKLQVSIAYFFDGLADPETAAAEGLDHGANEEVHAFLMTAEGVALVEALPKLPRRQRARLLALVREMAGLGEEEEVRPDLRVAA